MKSRTLKSSALGLWIVAASLSLPSEGFGADRSFVRGDSNADSVVDISDAVFTLLHLFSSGQTLGCVASADANDDGALDVSDAIYTLTYLFMGGPTPRAPFLSPGCDPTPDALGCAQYPGGTECVPTGAIIADHTTRDLGRIPRQSVEAAKQSFRIFYGHTSHGSQILTGMEAIKDPLYQFNQGAGTLSIKEEDSDLGNPSYSAWADTTRRQLDRADNDRNVVLWSWCGQVSGITEEDLQKYYLDGMSALEAQYPTVKFIHMTGHLDGTGVDGNLNRRNNQIREFCRANGKILFDFADIESYDPSGAYYLDRGADDACRYLKSPDVYGNWALEWCAAHPGECSSCSCVHSESVNCDMKARAFWWLLARMAGWDGQ